MLRNCVVLVILISNYVFIFIRFFKNIFTVYSFLFPLLVILVRNEIRNGDFQLLLILFQVTQFLMALVLIHNN